METHPEVKLIVMDSVAFHFRHAFQVELRLLLKRSLTWTFCDRSAAVESLFLARYDEVLRKFIEFCDGFLLTLFSKALSVYSLMKGVSDDAIA